MEFIASLRMGDFPGLDPSFTVPGGGRGYAHEETREHQFGVLEELATRYPVEGVELDFAAAPGGTSFWLQPEDVGEHTPLMTDYVRRISAHGAAAARNAGAAGGPRLPDGRAEPRGRPRRARLARRGAGRLRGAARVRLFRARLAHADGTG